MKIVAADPQTRVLSEDEITALLAEPIPMRLGMVDGHGWPLVNPVWHVFEDGVFRIAVGKSSHKANLLRANPRAYFAVDTGAAFGEARGVRGRATVRVHTGEGRDSRTDVYQDRRHYVWNNDHDTATLRNDRGRFVDDESWGYHDRDRGGDRNGGDGHRGGGERHGGVRR